MKMSSFPIPMPGFPNLATTQLLMSAAGGLALPTPSIVSSPKDGSPTGMTAAGLAGARVPGLPHDLSIATGHPGAGAAYLHPQFANIPPGMVDPRLLYSALNGGYDLKENADALLAWRQIAAQAQQAAAATSGVLSYDAHAAAMAAASFSYPSYPSMDLNGARRKNATRETTSTLKAWLYEHRKNPYPTKGEKIMLAIITKMTLTQVSTWFANARRRLKKENKMTWSPRNRTDDGSSIDDEEKPDNEDEVVGDDDDVSIDLSDFETENNSPQKRSVPTHPSSNVHHTAGSTATSNPATSPNTDSSNDMGSGGSGGSSKPRIWSLADVAANKPGTATHSASIHHQPPSVRHRPYQVPNSTAFRPWFDNSYRHLAGHPAAAAMLANPLLAGRPTTIPSSLRVPHLSSGSTNSTISSRSVRSPASSVSSPTDSNNDKTITTETVPHSSSPRIQVRDRLSPVQTNGLRRDSEH